MHRIPDRELATLAVAWLNGCLVELCGVPLCDKGAVLASLRGWATRANVKVGYHMCRASTVGLSDEVVPSQLVFRPVEPSLYTPVTDAVLKSGSATVASVTRYHTHVMAATLSCLHGCLQVPASKQTVLVLRRSPMQALAEAYHSLSQGLVGVVSVSGVSQSASTMCAQISRDDFLPLVKHFLSATSKDGMAAAKPSVEPTIAPEPGSPTTPAAQPSNDDGGDENDAASTASSISNDSNDSNAGAANGPPAIVDDDDESEDEDASGSSDSDNGADADNAQSADSGKSLRRVLLFVDADVATCARQAAAAGLSFYSLAALQVRWWQQAHHSRRVTCVVFIVNRAWSGICFSCYFAR